ncbi:MAG: ArdC-like ssDNA-binding domain-containing protein [Bacillota bacterium]
MEKLEKGVVPWRKPWVNGETQKLYRGINVFLLEDGEYATFKQIQEASGRERRLRKRKSSLTFGIT